ncbi:protoheme IX farnesyltransferase [Marinicauda pacifica]|uniref:Protoheme IX farnesyltransferase n=1 Tax=Marinicauda pacifica TaxID=1133559 RepID=A0A4S2HFH8_9PROT|nr:heme o synthase [Marinicauda pacifica]TGY94867.1 protoheme IX farnesyltransferase [Marinicauda pacifica]GGE39481.1 protoheme IX farnesyltransferase [Marinicauda pacifica]
MTPSSVDKSEGGAAHAASPPPFQDETKSGPSAAIAGPRDYFDLMKPRVMTLVVFTGLAGLVAAPGEINLFAAIIAVFALAVGAGAAGAINMAYDADIDAVMRRTRLRPVARGIVPVSEAYTYGIVFAIMSVLVMAMATNYVAAGLLAFSIAFYGLVYTVWLKRSTPQNIVIGGAAGAFPPMIGWAAVTGGVELNSILLFAIIFLWTPPHSWALALYKSGDYAAAGVPMMPVAKGARSTRIQIMIYTLAYLAATAAPLVTGLGGIGYGVAVIAGGGLFFLLSLRVLMSKAGEANAAEDELYAVRAGDKAARDLFAYSIAHLSLLFAALLVEHGAGLYVPLSRIGWIG